MAAAVLILNEVYLTCWQIYRQKRIGTARLYDLHVTIQLLNLSSWLTPSVTGIVGHYSISTGLFVNNQ